MSPPAGAAAPAVHRGRTVAPGRPRVVPRGPRRISGPTRRPARPGEQSAQHERGLAADVIALVGGFPSERLDRLIRGRSWIALIAFALIGIVALQLMLLKLNAGIGRSLERESLLQRQNAALSIESSELAAGNRVETQAAALGMELVPVSSLRFLSANPRADATRAASALKARAQAPTTGSEQPTSGETSSETPASSESSLASSAPTTDSEGPASPASGETSSEAGGESASAPASGEASTVGGAAEAAPAPSPAPAGAESAPQTGGAG